MQPLRPEHANKVSDVAGAPGFQVKRILAGYAYPQHGNLHNPTPHCEFQLLLDGRVVDMSTRDRVLRSEAKKPGAREAYSA